ncbi:ORF1292 [White spot syndrome virus]|uniref:Wsv517 n=3 Tax=White spot syndrome virus TaxID=342409 RepID=Q8VAA9_WSSVS|nr:wsv517 [Shrimp white spot syndrome virus]AFX59878.1 wsv517 [White spot syndrome virus]AAL33518.1 wsv517 [Shrimp white spot syndrome virus]AAL88910.1 WSSV042 [Shrimp white spot syndrome virus]ATU84181.1 ORF1292 [White spot syndrome virus]AWQ61050.1 wsv517 [Shrimp white spot syndrome virus]
MGNKFMGNRFHSVSRPIPLPAIGSKWDGIGIGSFMSLLGNISQHMEGLFKDIIFFSSIFIVS